ncbi:serine/Arginine-related protein 53-like [Athalia rosae]|uniref:serine/Arginine-related protein 53-like n=1 Tax=Athalia rosae TaxID=37344 RepID=UPI0006268A6F|nr:serine/Arginine-related protein 53-like [Athalia rosae]
MAKYSSDSDSDRSSRNRRKHHQRSRSTSSSSSDSSTYRKKSKYAKSRRRHRSKSRSRDKDRSSRSYKSSRGSSRDRDRRRYQSRKSKSYSPDQSKRKGRSVSREKSTSRSSSCQSTVKAAGVDKTQNSAAKDDFAIEPRIKEAILDEINSERFVPKQFTSSAHSKQSKPANIVIDITANTIKVPAATVNSGDSLDGIFHTSVTSDTDARFDKWVKKLYTLRQKAIIELSHTVLT